MIKTPTNLQEPWVPGQGCRQTVRMRGEREPALKLRFTWEGLHLRNGVQSRGQNRTREIRPSGIVGGLWETWSMVELGTRRTIERVRVGNSPPTDARTQFLSRQPHAAFDEAGAGNGSTVRLVECNIDFGTSDRLLSGHGNHTDSLGATRTT